MRRLALCGSIAVAVTGALLACGERELPAPVYVAQPTRALERVPFPPPPARVEFVPPQPRDEAVWIDGEWLWQARHWAWRPGRWVVPPRGAAFAPWTTVRDRTGALYIAEGAWRDRYGIEVGAPKPIATGFPSMGAIVNPQGESVQPAPVTSTSRPGLDASAVAVALAPDASLVPDASMLPDASLARDAALIPDASVAPDSATMVPPP